MKRTIFKLKKIIPIILLLYIMVFFNSCTKLHSAAPNGSWCGDQRQLSAANGSLN